jgi:SAM-dependent methyltransferase
MVVKNGMNLYLDEIVKEGMYPNRGNLKFEMKSLFKGVNFKNKKVLDIGGGVGLYSFYAASMGAEKILCLEPEAQGSSSKMIKKFTNLKNQLKMINVFLEPIKFQSFNSNGETFDIIILHNSINHLDETACINLLENKNAVSVYQNIFLKISSLSNRGANLIISDCSRYNFFNLLKIKNPFSPSIEWHKHQAPETWVNMLRTVGFLNPKIRWLSFNSGRWLGDILLGNKLMAYFLHSYFCLTMKKQ